MKEESIQNRGVKKAVKCHCIPRYCIRELKPAWTDVGRRSKCKKEEEEIGEVKIREN